MSNPTIIAAIVIVVILVAVGLIYTFKQFNDMNEEPENYRFDRSEEPDVDKKDSGTKE